MLHSPWNLKLKMNKCSTTPETWSWWWTNAPQPLKLEANDEQVLHNPWNLKLTTSVLQPLKPEANDEQIAPQPFKLEANDEQVLHNPECDSVKRRDKFHRWQECKRPTRIPDIANDTMSLVRFRYGYLFGNTVSNHRSPELQMQACVCMEKGTCKL